MQIIKYRFVFFIASGLLVLGSLISLFTFGLNLGIDFRGGAILELAYSAARPPLAEIKNQLKSVPLNLTVQPAGDNGLILKSGNITANEKAIILAALTAGLEHQITEQRFSSIGPSLGTELARKGLIAIAIVAVLIILFITVAFLGVSRPVASWKYGVVAIITLIHDVTIPAGVFSLLGHFYGVEADALFLTALLTILSLSVNDTIVVFDRIRENLKNRISPHFAETVGRSLDQTIGRSVNSSLTVVIVLLAILFLGGEPTRYFALTLTIGMIVGTYSSIFIASPLLVVWEKWGRKS